MSAHVDVLAVVDAQVSVPVDVLAVLRAARDSVPAEQLLDYCAAVAAMAGLIAADCEYDEAERYFYDPSVKGVDLVKAQERLRTATQRRRAALARVQGGAQ